MKRCVLPLLAFLYLFLWCFTAGYYYNKHRNELNVYGTRDSVAWTMGSFAAGMFWPIYWMAKLSVDGTRWADPNYQPNVEK